MDVEYPSWILTKTPIYHITAIGNLKNIAESQYLYSTNSIPCSKISIANEEVQQRRSVKKVEIPPHGCIHDYVPFYFAPRSPMLYVNHKGNIQNAKPQKDIVHLVTYAQKIAEAKLPFVFYDRHAILELAAVYNTLNDLDKIDWDLFFEPPIIGRYSRYWDNKNDPNHHKWTNRQDVRQAEFLVHEKLPWNFIEGIATMNKDKENEVKNILSAFNLDTQVKVKQEWYY